MTMPIERDGWFELSGDARLGRCATEGCGGQPTLRLEADGVGSDYCSGCAERIRALSTSPQAPGVVGVPTERVCIPDPHHPGARIVGFRIREGDEAWGESGLSEPLFWLDRLSTLVSTPPVSGEVGELVDALSGLDAGEVLDEYDAEAVRKAASALTAANAERDALYRERTNLIETKRDQLAALTTDRDRLARELEEAREAAFRAGHAQGRVGSSSLEEDEHWQQYSAALASGEAP